MRISDWSSDVCSSDLLAQRQVGESCGIGIGFDRIGLANLSPRCLTGKARLPIRRNGSQLRYLRLEIKTECDPIVAQPLQAVQAIMRINHGLDRKSVV